MNYNLPTALLMELIAKAKKSEEGGGVWPQLLTKYFRDNFGKVTLPKTVADFIIYDQVVGVGNKNLEFFQGTYSTARSNFPSSNFILPESEHALILGIAFRDGANAVLEDTAWQPGISDAICKNGNLTVTSNGNTMLTTMPMTSFPTNLLAATFAGDTENDAGINWLRQPIPWLGQTDIKSIVKLNKALVTANYNVRMELHGIRFIGG